MKITFIISVFLLLFGCVTRLGAQENKPGQTMISIGAGYGNITSNTGPVTSELPELSGTIDYFVISNYSMGVSAAYQSITSNYTYGGSYPNPPTNYSETQSRFNVSIRSLVYFTTQNKPGLYAGVRLGYAYWLYSYSPSNPNPNNTQPSRSPTFQVFAGARATITGGFSTYFELGIGAPYYAEMGFSICLGGRAPAEKNADPGSYYDTEHSIHH